MSEVLQETAQASFNLNNATAEELEQEKVQKALEWDRARLRVTGALVRMKVVLSRPHNHTATPYCDLLEVATDLVQTLEELERVERGGV